MVEELRYLDTPVLLAFVRARSDFVSREPTHYSTLIRYEILAKQLLFTVVARSSADLAHLLSRLFVSTSCIADILSISLYTTVSVRTIQA